MLFLPVGIDPSFAARDSRDQSASPVVVASHFRPVVLQISGIGWSSCLDTKKPL